jgi:C4-dicarboxylate transporter, DctM subunit
MPCEKMENVQIAVENASNAVSSVIIVFMMLLTTVDVCLRYVFNSPLPGVFILCEMLMVGTVYLAAAYVQQQKGHVRVDIVIEKLKGAPRISLELATLILALVAFGLVLWQSAVYAWDAWITDDHTMGLVEYPVWPAKAVLTVGIGLLCLRLATDIRHGFCKLHHLGRSEPSAPHAWLLWAGASVLPLALLAGYFALSPAEPTLDPATVGWCMLVVMILILFAGLPVSFALLVLGVVGYWIIAGPVRTLSIVGIVPYEKMANYTLSVVPLFILMGHLAYHAGFANSLYITAQKWVGHIPGSLAQATVLGGAVFGAACGSGLASCATLARICIPAMRNVGIDTRLAVGTVAGTGTIAQMIPPSILMVIYAVITDQSVAKLLIAGIIPGIIAAANYMIMIYVRCRLNPALAPQTLKEVSWKERFISLKHSWGIGVIALVVMGGIYSGIFTPTEAGALGAFGVLSLGVVSRRLKIADVREAVRDSTQTTAMIFLIIATALLFGYFLGISRIPAAVSDLIVGLNVHRLVILMGILLMYIIAGFFIDMLAFAFLTLPIVFPSITALGYDPLWFGVITVHMFEVALITPPFGLNLFIIRGMVPEASMGEIIQGVLWFAAMDVVTLIIYVMFPQVATWLPSLM